MRKAFYRQAWLRCLLCSLALFPFSSFAEPSPEGLLDRMVKALSERNFQISLVANHAGNIQPVRLEHGVVEGESIYHLSYLDGPMRDIVKRGDEISYFEHDSVPYSLRRRPMSGPLPSAFINGLGDLKNSYEFVLGGRNRVSGRLAQMVRIIPRDPHRYGMLVWVDVKTGFLLQLDYVDRTGVSAEQIQVVHMMIDGEPSEQLLAIADASLPAVVDRTEMLNQADRQVRWQCDWVPTGFVAVAEDRHRLALTDDVVDYIMYADGLVRFSVYVNDVGNARDNATLLAKGATSFYSEIRDGKEIAVVGRIPMETAKRIAGNIHPKKTVHPNITPDPSDAG